jgi:hypothetical protein
LTKLFSHVSVGIVGLFKKTFQLGQLFQSEIGSTPARFDFTRLHIPILGVSGRRFWWRLWTMNVKFAILFRQK